LKKILALITTHVRQDFQYPYYITLVVLLAALLTINYSLDLENTWIDQYPEKIFRVFLYFLLYGFGYYAACLIVSHFKKVTDFWRSKKFWLFSLFGLSVLAIAKGFPYLPDIMNSLQQPYEVYAWLYRVAGNVTSFVIMFLPLSLFYIAIDHEKSGVYGLTTKSNIKPYLYLLLMLIPFILIASFQQGFTDYYPVYKSNTVSEIWNWPSYLPMMLFEFFYGIDFINVEFLFRGFFVIGMAQILGKHSIMPMVVIYCLLHFGKPSGEAITSIFGGFILGILALYTRSIWGGIMIHIGIAWLMEVIAYFSKQL
jgi:hypothetical protein